MNKILIVDDETDILDLLKYNLQKEGYEVATALDGKEALDICKTFHPNLILLDVMMPKMDGIETCRNIRQISGMEKVFILFLTARSEEYSEIAAFDSGANDYITKPVKPRALLSRISAFFKRETQKTKDTSLKFNDLVVDRESYTVYKNERRLSLPRKEFELLYFLMQHPKMVFSRDELLKNVWGADVYVVPRTVDVHVRKLREKLGENLIHTIKGIGYKFDPAMNL